MYKYITKKFLFIILCLLTLLIFFQIISFIPDKILFGIMTSAFIFLFCFTGYLFFKELFKNFINEYNEALTSVNDIINSRKTIPSKEEIINYLPTRLIKILTKEKCEEIFLEKLREKTQ